MNRTTRNMIAVVCAAAVLAGIVGLVVCLRGCGPAPRYEDSFQARVRAEAPLPNRETVNVVDLPALADQYPAFREWLIQFLMSPDEDLDVRGHVLNVTHGMRNDTAVHEMAQRILKSFDAGKPGSNRERRLRLTMLQQLAHRALGADWPVPETLELMQRAGPEQGGWRRMLEAQAALTPGTPTEWPEDEQIKRTARAKALLEYADSQQSSKAAKG